MQDKFGFSLILSSLKMKLFRTFINIWEGNFWNIPEVIASRRSLKLSKYSQLISFSNKGKSCWQPELTSWIQVTMQQNTILSSFQFVTSKYPVKFVTGQFTNSSLVWAEKYLPTTNFWHILPEVESFKCRGKKMLCDINSKYSQLWV